MELLIDTAAWFTEPGRWTYAETGSVPFRAVQHIWATLVTMALAITIAVPPALYLAHHRRAEAAASAVVNLGRAIPSFGLIVLFWLLALRIDWVGGEFWPLIGALVALALPPIFTNTYTAVREVDAATVEAARGMGYRERRILADIELPLASPVMLAGIRIANVQVIATVAIGAIVTNGGGFGRYITDAFAIGAGAHHRALAGAILVAVLTLAFEGLYWILQRVVLPRGVRGTADVAEVATRAGAAG